MASSLRNGRMARRYSGRAALDPGKRRLDSASPPTCLTVPVPPPIDRRLEVGNPRLDAVDRPRKLREWETMMGDIGLNGPYRLTEPGSREPHAIDRSTPMPDPVRKATSSPRDESRRETAGSIPAREAAWPRQEIEDPELEGTARETEVT
jgi:hypothetical protein